MATIYFHCWYSSVHKVLATVSGSHPVSSWPLSTGIKWPECEGDHMHPFALEFLESVELCLCTPFLMTWHHACDKRTRLIFWDVMSCILVCTFQRNLLHLSSGFMSSFLKTEAAGSVEMLTPAYLTTWCHSSEYCILISPAVKTPNPKKDLYLYLNIHFINRSSSWICYTQVFHGIRIMMAQMRNHFRNRFPPYMYSC